MSNTITPLFVTFRTRRRQAVRRGQSVVVALLVLLLLGFVGALFITIVARNVFNARHAAVVVNADYYAKAGITFADAQLTYGPDGADWRPPLQNTVLTPPLSWKANRYAASGLAPIGATDPDKAYIEQGYTRYTAGAGRFLLRLTYDPVNINGATTAPGRYIKIEAIGREGVIDPLDPTTYGNNRSSNKTQSFLVAYKPIGITDYARFETNFENRSDIANLGVASQQYAADLDGGIATPGATDFTGSGNNYQLYPIVTTYGAYDAYLKVGTGLFPNPNAGKATTPDITKYISGGGSNRANMPVRYFGKNVFYLHDAGSSAPLLQDASEIYGNLLLDNYQPKDKLDNSGVPTVGQRAVLSLNPTDPTKPITTGTLISPSNAGQVTGDVNPPFDTQGGLIRDGSSQNDANGLPRSIKRLDPPLMDAVDPGSSLPRYKQIALTSPPRLDISTPTQTPYPEAGPTNKTAAANGYGRTIYINNPSDVQQESASIGNGTTLTDEWLNTTKASSPTNGTVGGWNGDVYNPVGVNITLGMQSARIRAPGGAVTTRTFPGIRLTRSDNVPWKSSYDTAIVGTNNDGTSASTMYVAYDSVNASNDPNTVVSGDNLNNDVLIYAEGIVRVHGIVSPNENTSSGAPKTIPRHVTIVTNGTAYIDGNILKGDQDSSITILAHDYVCVNTTQFLAGTQNEDFPALIQAPKTIGTTTFNAFTLGEVTDALVQDLSFGLPDPAQTVGGTYPKLHLYISGASETGIDPSSSVNFGLYDQNLAPLPVGGILANFGSLSRQTFDISASAAAGLFQSDVGQLKVMLDATNKDPAKSGKFLLQRAAILPADIRIEAVLYAQTRSFFVIPGPSFNSSPDDTLDTFAAKGTRDLLTDPRFPLYGQPIDMKIVIDGAVSESRPADINAQTAWMLRWGWIPQFHGSLLTENAGHPNRVGLQMIYNPQAGYPYNPVNSYYLRSDQYGRPLPFTPRLPVSTGLLYSGESGEAPILQ